MQQPTASENIEQRILGIESPQLVFDERFQTNIAVEIHQPLNRLADAASVAGFNLQIASHYRSFDRQLIIWNEKVQAKRPVLDENGQAIAINRLSDDEKIFAILRWSSLPGASRHHWGTDVDVFDASRMPEGYRVQLTREETEGDGVFADFHVWLTDYLKTNSLKTTAQNFYRPYSPVANGQAAIGMVAEEPWHLSYAPLAQKYSALLTESLLAKQIESTPIELKAAILTNLPVIFENYVRPYQ